MKEMLGQVVETARSSPLRFASWIVALGVLAVGCFIIGEGLGQQLYMFTH
jgi:hypothetical protein